MHSYIANHHQHVLIQVSSELHYHIIKNSSYHTEKKLTRGKKHRYTFRQNPRDVLFLRIVKIKTEAIDCTLSTLYRDRVLDVY